MHGLGLGHCGRWNDVEYYKIRKIGSTGHTNNTLVEKAYVKNKSVSLQIDQSVGLNINQPVTTKEMELLADEWQLQIHCFDINCVNPYFSYHSPNLSYGDHLYFARQRSLPFHF